MQIPGFELLEKLGEGGMATVWKARQLSLDRTVAIKILSSRLSRDKSDTERFLKEAQAMAALKHPGIIQVYDANIHDGMHYFVMEFVAGYSVGQWIRRKQRIAEGDALLTADYVADALHYAWKTQRMIHCDVKPDNIMIDADGTIKVADLGLAKSIGTSGARAESSDVMGTPNFMSPEQVMGEPDLDCRADIYSLGAMLYHMVTGRLLFQEFSVGEAMGQQVRGLVPDPLDLNPDLSMGTCWMIEKMLAKDKNLRQADWDAVLTDISRVMKGKMPAGVELPEGVSTVKRSAQRNRIRGRRVTRMGGDIRAIRPLRTYQSAWMPVLAAALVAVVVGGLMWRSQSWKIKDLEMRPPPAAPEPFAEDPHVARGAAAFKAASDWFRSHPDDYDGAMQRFEGVASDYAQTRFSPMALSRIEQMKEARDRGVKNVLAGLEEKTGELLRGKRFEEAEALCSGYRGQFFAETAEKRKQMAENIRRKAMECMTAEELAKEAKKRKSAELLNGAAERLVTDGVGSALKMMEAAMKEEGLGDVAQLVETADLLRRLESLDERVLKSFKVQEGRTLTVGMRSGNVTVKILNVVDGKVHCEEVIVKGNYTATRSLDLDLDQLSAGEMVARLGQGDQEEVVFRKGILALQSRAFDLANDYFGKCSCPLSPILAKKAAGLDEQETNNAAEQALARTLRIMRIAVPEKYSENSWRAAIARTTLSADPQAVETKVEAYRKAYGNSTFGRNAAGLLTMLVAKAKEDAERAAIAAMEQIDEPAIRKMLLMHNTDLDPDAIEIEKSDKYLGYRLSVRSSQMASIGSLRACGSTITELDLSGSGIKDLSNISGMVLRSLDISNTRVTTMPMLFAVPLERLAMRSVQVKDLSFLSRTKLKALDLSGTRVNDLKAIKQLPLESLAINDAIVKSKDYSPLKGLPLKYLSIRNGAISSIAPFQKMPLESLDLSGNRDIEDVSGLAGMPLRVLNLDGTGVSDLSALKELPLGSLSAMNTRLADLGALSGMALRSLNISGTEVRDLKPLTGMPLTFLDICRTDVGNLSPLRGMRLNDLRISQTKVTDLSPLSGMALNRFYCEGIWPTSWDPLIGMPIGELVISLKAGESQPAFVRTLKRLRWLNGRECGK